MKHCFFLTLALLLTAGLSVGCDQSGGEPASSPGEAGAAETTEDGAKSLYGQSVESATNLAKEVGEAGEKMMADAEEAVEAGTEKVEEVVQAGKDKVDEVMGGGSEAAADSGGAGITLDSLEPGTLLSAVQADAAIQKVKDLIGEQNYDLAKQWISKLDSVQLPDGYAEQLAGLKDLLSKAQGVGNALNSLGK